MAVERGPRMPTLYEKLDTEVRAFFATGHKSGNKGYSLSAATKADGTLETLMKVELRNAAWKSRERTASTGGRSTRRGWRRSGCS